MAKYTFDMVLEYAKVFEGNADMGDPKSSHKWLRELHKSGGRTSVNAYFTSEEQIAQLEGEGFERMTTNPKTGEPTDRIKVGSADYGLGQFLNLTRKISDVKEFVNKKGDIETVDFGGLPKVVDLTKGAENKRFWDFDTDGPLGNGTKAKVQFDVYNGRTVRLLAIGVTEHVPYDQPREISEDDELFMVA